MSYITKSFDEQVVSLLKSGGIGFMPTDTIYGLSARAMDEKAVTRVRRAKERSQHKPFIVLISDVSQIDQLGLIKPEGFELAAEYWPGPLSIEFDARHSSLWLHPGSDFFAVRMPAKKELLSLIDKVGPIISTSANPQDRKPASSCEEAQNYFGEDLDFYVDAGEIAGGKSSTLIKIKDGQVEVIRQGAVIIKE